MRRWIEEYQIPLIFTLIVFSCLALASASYALFGHKIIEAMYKGASIGFLNKVIEGRLVHPLEYYLEIADKGIINLLFSALLISLPISSSTTP